MIVFAFMTCADYRFVVDSDRRKAHHVLPPCAYTHEEGANRQKKICSKDPASTTPERDGQKLGRAETVYDEDLRSIHI